MCPVERGLGPHPTCAVSPLSYPKPVLGGTVEHIHFANSHSAFPRQRSGFSRAHAISADPTFAFGARRARHYVNPECSNA
jgi:hypothetical protein